MSNMTWKEVLQRDDLVGGDLEVEDFGTLIRGPIVEVTYIPDQILIQLEWAAGRGTDTPWQAADLNHSIAFFGTTWPLVVVRDDYIEFRPDPASLGDQPDLYDKLVRRIYPKGTDKLLPELVEGLAKLLNRTQWDYPVVVMTDEEWIALCGSGDPFGGEPEDDYPALPVCCGNISDMREAIQVVREQSGSVTPTDLKRLTAAYQGLFEMHDPSEWDWTILNKLMEQVELGVVTNSIRDRETK